MVKVGGIKNPTKNITDKGHFVASYTRIMANIPLEVCRNVVDSMNRPCLESIKHNGYATKH